MPVRRDLSGLPRPTSPHGGAHWAPDAEPRFGRVLADLWFAESEAAGPRERAHADARFRHSDAGGCSRALAYAALDIEPTNPMDLPGVFIARMGEEIHKAWQEALQLKYPMAQVEVQVHDGERAGHVDAVVRLPSSASPMDATTIAIEGKSVGGFAFKQAVGCPPAAREAYGPRWSAVVQAALNAARVDADEAVVIYWSREAISVQMARDRGFEEVQRVIAEWTMPREVYEPIAVLEQDRVDKILALLDEGTLPARKIPPPLPPSMEPPLPVGHLIVDPIKGQWVARDDKGLMYDTGTTWQCQYCHHQSLCALTPAERCSVDVLRGGDT